MGLGGLRHLRGGGCHHMGDLACVLLYITRGYCGLLGKPGQSCVHRDTMEHNEPSGTWLPAPLGAGSWKRTPTFPGDGIPGGLWCGTNPIGDTEPRGAATASWVHNGLGAVSASKDLVIFNVRR